MGKVILKLHVFDLISSMVFLGRKVTPEDIAHHLYTEYYGDTDKYEILGAVKDAIETELSLQDKNSNEDRFGIRNAGNLYWLSYDVASA